MRAGVGRAGATQVFFETHAVEWILHRTACTCRTSSHEHAVRCSLAESLKLALERAWLQVSEVRHVFGGQYLWAEAQSSDGQRHAPAGSSTPRRSLGSTLPPADEQSRLASWNSLLAELAPAGRRVRQGPTKGVTFCNLADPDARRLAGIVDVNPAKQGKFLPGTGHPIVSPAAAAQSAAVLVLNPNYVGEVRIALERLGSPADAIDLMGGEIPCALVIDTDARTAVTARNARRSRGRPLRLARGVPVHLEGSGSRSAGRGAFLGYGFTWLGRPLIQLPEDVDSHSGSHLPRQAGRDRRDRRRARRVAHLLREPVQGDRPRPRRRRRRRDSPAPSRFRHRSPSALTSYITLIQGSSRRMPTSREPGEVAHQTETKPMLVVLDSNHSRPTRRVMNWKRTVPLVTVGSYIVATDGIMADVAGKPGAHAQNGRQDNPPAKRRGHSPEGSRALGSKTTPLSFNEGRSPTA